MLDRSISRLGAANSSLSIYDLIFDYWGYYDLNSLGFGMFEVPPGIRRRI